VELDAQVGGSTLDAGTVTVSPAGVAVTPHGATGPQRIAGSSGNSENFTVQNTGTAQNTYNLSCPNSANVTCTGLTIHGNSVSSVTLAGGNSDTVVASYNVGAAVGTWTLSLTATGTNASDAGSYQVPVVMGNALPPVVDLTPMNPSSFRDHELCLTIATGPAAASECGDLRIVHALPTTRTMNKPRTPTLLYNSQTAHPYPIVAVNVTLPATAGVPDSVTGTVWIGPPQVRTKWLGGQWAPGQTRRVALGFDGLSFATGVYGYTLDIINWYPAPTDSQRTRVTGELVIVNRSGSPFGAGWWLAGLEEFYWLPDGRKLMVLGDGSARVYSPVGGNLYTTPNPTRPDTLDGSGTDYVRRAPHGVRVHISATTGKHIFTLNRLGHRTDFAYDQSCGRLSTITVPPAGSGATYTFNYASPTDCATRLANVTAPPGNRTTTLTNPAGKVTAIADPDGTGVGFGYDANFANRITSRTDRRGNPTFYAFDAGGKLIADSLPLGTGQTPIVQRLRPAESIGLTAAVDTALVYTSLNGPRTDITNDTTAFWLDSFGAPRRIVNALGYQTLLKREDSRWPALVTELQAPNQFVTRAGYDARGNILADTALNPLGDGRSAITRYEWDSRWDFVTKIVRPELDSVVMSYDANGNRQWQQDGRGASSETDFFYYSGPDSVNGLLRSIRTPSLPTSRDSVNYNALGNLAATKTPSGFWTFYYKDNIGRDTLVVSPTLNDSPQYQRVDSIRYDLADRVTRTRSVGPRLHYYDPIGAADSLTKAESLWVATYYNAEGLPDSVRRWVRPNWNSVDTLTTKWTYDAAGRRLKEIAPDGAADSTVYDPAGNVLSALTRRNDPTSGARLTINMSYDALNRLTQRIKPSVSYGPWNPHAQNEIWYFPGYRADASGGLTVPNDGTFGLTIAGETEAFTYDTVGNILTADNAAARIRRRYNRNGTLSADTLKILPYVGTDTTVHVYGLLITYDLDGRRISLKHPSTIAPRYQGSANDTEGYQYYSTTGLLRSVTNVLGNGFEYTYDLENRVAQLDRGEFVLGGSPEIRVTYTYDADGRDSLRMEAWVGGSQVTHADTLFYDARNKVVRTRTSADTTNLTYTGLGPLAWSSSFQRQSEYPSSRPSERYLPDALGNLYDATHVEDTGFSVDVNGTVFQTNTGRLLQSWHAAARGNPHSAESNKTYDAAGNIYQADGWSNNTYNGEQLVERTASYYDAAGRLRVQDHRSCLMVIQTLLCDNGYAPDYNDRAAFEEYRYDALGRRVLVRTRSEFHCGLHCRNAITRFVWDGDQILYEISSPGATSATVAQLEQDTAQVNDYVGDEEPYGRVVYTHGANLDAPLGLVRVNFSPVFPEPTLILPLANWQGQYDMGIIAGYKNPSTTSPPTDFCRKYPNPMTSPLYCFRIDWPAPYMWKTLYSRSRGLHGPRGWNGSLIEGSRDNTGQMYRRNRYYDPASGRFTQEDPIGLAGGFNLYGFAAGDPVTFSDPFGLRVCFRGAGRDALASATGQAVGASIVLDLQGCVQSVTTTETSSKYAVLRNRFMDLVNDPETYTVALTGRGLRGSSYQLERWIGIRLADQGVWYYQSSELQTCGLGPAGWTLPAIIAHELLGHAYGQYHSWMYRHRIGQILGLSGEDYAMKAENMYHSAAREPTRCAY